MIFNFVKKILNRNLTESDIECFNVVFQIEQKIQKQETKDSGWRFAKNNSMIIFFQKTTKMNGSIYTGIHLRSSAILNNESEKKFAFFVQY